MQRIMHINPTWSRLIVLIGLLLATTCSPGVQASQVEARNRIVYGLTLLPSGFDPHIHASSELGIPLRSVYDTLVYRDLETGEFVPGLATNWTISDDGLIYTFTLREGVTFHDGNVFNSQSVASNLDRITNPDLGSQKAVFLLGAYDHYEIVSEFEIRLYLTAPFSPLLDSLSQVYLGIASPAAFGQLSNNRYQFHQVGTGPFTFVEYVPGDRIVLRRNPDYAWGPAFYTEVTEDSVDEIEFRFFTDSATRAPALESGEVDIVGELPPIDARILTANTEVQLIPVAVPGQPLQFLMNTDRFPTDNLEIRRALLYAANRNAIIDTVYQRFSPIAWGPVSENTAYYNREVVGVYAHNTELAQQVFEAQGFVDSDNNGYRDFNGVELEVTVIVPPWGLVPDAAQLLQDQWRTAGARANLESVPTFGALLEAVDSGEYNLVAFNSFGVDPSYLNQFFLTDGGNNWMNYSNLDLDRVLLEGARQSNTALRQDMYFEAQRIIMNEALILPLRDYVNLNAASTRLVEPQFDPYGWFPLLHNFKVRGE
jgi:peptide/nickel transport system substrate-binding protein